MRINNSKIRSVIITAYFFLFFAVIVGMLVFGLFKEWLSSRTLEYIIFLAVFGLLFFLLHKTAIYFEYDSDGEALVLINKGLILSEFFNYRLKKAEFPKEKLLYYKLNDYIIYKSLNLYIRSGDNRQKRLKFNVTLLRPKKIKYLKMSLNKVVKQNKANC